MQKGNLYIKPTASTQHLIISPHNAVLFCTLASVHRAADMFLLL